jgi:hypothetical protein
MKTGELEKKKREVFLSILLDFGSREHTIIWSLRIEKIKGENKLESLGEIRSFFLSSEKGAARYIFSVTCGPKQAQYRGAPF